MVGAVLLVTVGAEAAVIIGGSRFVGIPGLLLMVLASAAWALVATDERVDRRPRLVLLAIVVAVVVAIATPPRSSHDIWSYVMYGRTLAVHHMSPYVHPPADFPHDVFFQRVASGWEHTRSVYGPLFTGGSALLTRVAGNSALRARLAFQGLSAVAIAVALTLVWKETHSARALAFLGLNPAVITSVVNGGHNDALVGLAILGGALLAIRRRWYGAGFVLGLGILVKASTGLGLLGIAAWTVGRDRRGAARLVIAAALTTIVGYLPAGMVAVRAARHAGNGNTRASVWDPITTVTHLNVGIALLAVLTLAVVAAYLRRTRSRPTNTALASTATYLIGGTYVLPWYAAWALPIAALERRSRLAWLVAAQSVFLAVVYEFEAPAHPYLRGPLAYVRSTAVDIVAWTALAALLVIVFGGRARRSVLTRHPTE